MPSWWPGRGSLPSVFSSNLTAARSRESSWAALSMEQLISKCAASNPARACTPRRRPQSFRLLQGDDGTGAEGGFGWADARGALHGAAAAVDHGAGPGAALGSLRGEGLLPLAPARDPAARCASQIAAHARMLELAEASPVHISKAVEAMTDQYKAELKPVNDKYMEAKRRAPCRAQRAGGCAGERPCSAGLMLAAPASSAPCQALAVRAEPGGGAPATAGGVGQV